MKKILKKSLACMLAAILCLTACVGAMATVGAEGAITYAIADVTVNQGEETVIDVAISNFADVAGLIAEITVPDAVKSIDSVKLNDTVELVAIGETAGHYIVDGKTVKFVGLFNSLNEFGDAFATVDALEINIAVTIAADAEGEYSFAAPVFQAGTANEEILDVNGAAGKLIVTVPCKHAETKTEETVNVAATCTTDGSKTVVTKCVACDEVISTEEVAIKATGHTEETIPAVDATCTTAGATAGVKCSVCGTVITAPETVDALGHNWVDGDITYTDCTSNGNMAQNCSRCDATQTVAVDPKGHTEVAYEEVAATCTTVGYTGGKYCSECDAVIEARTEIPATGHTDGEAVEENRIEAQPGVAGSYEMATYCTVCKVETNRTYHTIPALPEVVECEHEWVVVSATPAEADAQHNETAKGSIVFDCAKCDETKTEEVGYYRYYACASTNAAYESEIQFQLNARKEHLTRQGAIEEAFIKIVKSYATDDAPIVKYWGTADAEEKNVSGKDCYVWSIGIPAKELNDNINANVYVKFNGAWYSGQSTNKSVVEYAMNVIGGASETEKALIANMLNYGAKAQKFFKYDTQNLADANLGQYASYVKAETATAVDYYNNSYNTQNSEVILHKFNLEMASKVGLRTYFRTDYYTTGELNDLKVTASYETSAGTSSKTYTSADYVLETGKTDRYTFNYDVIPAKFMRAKVTLVAYNGDTQVSTTVTHSIESLVARLWNTISEDERAVYSAMLNFGDAAAAHFKV